MVENNEIFKNEEGLTMEDILREQDISMKTQTHLGETIKAKVISVNQEVVTIDIGLKSEAFVPIEEFFDDNDNLNIKVGEEIEVFLLKREDEHGMPKVSYKEAKVLRIFEELKSLFEKKSVLDIKIIQKIKGGYRCRIKGMDAFMPMSQLPFALKDKQDAAGEDVKALIIKYEDRGPNIVVSSREYENIEREEKRKELIKLIKPGVALKGRVKTIAKFGAFIDLGGLDALAHISDLSWTKVGKVEDVVSIGQELEVMVLNFDEKEKKVSVGIKQLLPDPWEKVLQRVHIGSVVTGKVKKVLKTGVFVEIDKGIEGFIHISDMSWFKKVRQASDVLNEKDSVQARVLNIDEERRTIGLGLKQIEQNPWQKAKERYKEGNIIRGVVTSISNFGAFVKLEEGIDGLIHIENMSWNSSIRNPNDVLKKGDAIEAVVLKIDVERERISLGLKQKEDDPFKRFLKGQNHKVAIKKVLNSSLIVELEGGFNGIIPYSQTDVPRETDLNTMFKSGDTLIAKINKVDTRKRELIFSIRGYNKEKEQEEIQQILGAEDFNPTFGDLLKNKLNKMKPNNND
ncbi:30S ribosomal protein S1 [bacterium]